MRTKRFISALFLFVGLFSGAAVFGLNAACIIIADGDPFFLPGGDYREDFQKTLPLSASGSFSLKNTNGDVLVSTWPRNEVEIKAVKIAKRAESDLDRVKIEVSAAGDSVRVDTIYEKTFLRNIRVEVKYEVKVPEGVRLEDVHTTNGDVELVGRFGDANAGTTNGDIRLESASGRCSASTTNGDINVHNVKGPVDAETTNGSIHIDIQAVEAGIKAETTNGSITLKMAGDVNANLRVHTTNGHIRTDYPVTVRGMVKSRRSLEGTFGNGGPEIELQTTNGSITITR